MLSLPSPPDTAPPQAGAVTTSSPGVPPKPERLNISEKSQVVPSAKRICCTGLLASAEMPKLKNDSTLTESPVDTMVACRVTPKMRPWFTRVS